MAISTPVTSSCEWTPSSEREGGACFDRRIDARHVRVMRNEAARRSGLTVREGAEGRGGTEAAVACHGAGADLHLVLGPPAQVAQHHLGHVALLVPPGLILITPFLVRGEGWRLRLEGTMEQSIKSTVGVAYSGPAPSTTPPHLLTVAELVLQDGVVGHPGDGPVKGQAALGGSAPRDAGNEDGHCGGGGRTDNTNAWHRFPEPILL